MNLSTPLVTGWHFVARNVVALPTATYKLIEQKFGQIEGTYRVILADGTYHYCCQNHHLVLSYMLHNENNKRQV